MMAYANPFYPASAAINSKRSAYYSEDDDSAILDSSILDIHSPTDAQPRKSSLATANGILTPIDTHVWNPAYGGGLPVGSSSDGHTHPFQDGRNAFAEQAPPPASAFIQSSHPDNWNFEQGSGHCTPTNGQELEFAHPLPPGYEYAHRRNDSARGSFSHQGPSVPQPHYHQQHHSGTIVPAPHVQSPHSHQEWMDLNQMDLAHNDVEARRASKRMRAGSPPRTSIDMQRRDGIRKKNGRIDIPGDRNIDNIDEMIELATDDAELKELKQQKRLLRNREAALASRQRKKKHTEELETREKGYSQQLSRLEHENACLHNELQRSKAMHLQEHQIISQQLDEARRYHAILQDEKRDMELVHANETAQLRKKIQVLTADLEAAPAPMMSAQPSSTGFTEFTGDMGALTMETDEWDGFDFFTNADSSLNDDFAFDVKADSAHSPPLDKRSSPTSVATITQEKPTDLSNDPPIASGLLFFLLLCGAFVASKPDNIRPRYIPHVPEEVRDAAPALIRNLLSESAPSSAYQHLQGSSRHALEPAPSGLMQATGSHGRLDQIHHRITSPTKEQEAASAFSLTTQQYASISGMDYLAHNDRSGPGSRHNTPPTRRRNLAETLASMEAERAHSNRADVYTRSLLWDQIPADVVRQFKEMARDHDELETQRQSQTSHDDTYAFKVEP